MSKRATRKPKQETHSFTKDGIGPSHGFRSVAELTPQEVAKIYELFQMRSRSKALTVYLQRLRIHPDDGFAIGLGVLRKDVVLALEAHLLENLVTTTLE